MSLRKKIPFSWTRKIAKKNSSIYNQEVKEEEGNKGGNTHLIELIEEFKANYKAIIHSDKLSDRKKNTMLKNLLIDIESIFFKSCSKEQPSIEKQQEAAKQLYQDIKMDLLSY